MGNKYINNFMILYGKLNNVSVSGEQNYKNMAEISEALKNFVSYLEDGKIEILDHFAEDQEIQKEQRKEDT